MTFTPAHEDILLHAPGRGWLHFTRPLAVLQARTLSEVRPAMAEIERLVNQDGHYAAGFISYEAAPAFDPAHVVHPEVGNDFPLLWFGIYDQPALWVVEGGVLRLALSTPSGAVGDDEGAVLRLALSTPDGTVRDDEAGVLRLAFSTLDGEVGEHDWRPDVTLEVYRAALGQIKEHIAAGRTYQVNYTYRLRSAWSEQPFPTFAALAAAHSPPYAAYVETGDWAVASLSPELFFTLEGETLTSRPMKGTAPRGYLLEDDRAWAEWLYRSEKNRAENVMIVDMVRNDLGRIARTGSVRVPELFKIEKYPTVWQMTSTVQAETGAGLEAIFAALFPCASITGAPKIRTMQIIAGLERSPRRIYTGAIGYYAPGRQAQFNVAIRTLRVDKRAGEAEYGVGGGIVWDSQVEEEWEETKSKARVLVELPRPFDLLETLRWSPGEGWHLLELHLKRLERSAAYFDYPYDRGMAVTELERLANEFESTLVQRVRLTLSRSGAIAVQHRPLPFAVAGTGDPGLAAGTVGPGYSLDCQGVEPAETSSLGYGRDRQDNALPRGTSGPNYSQAFQSVELAETNGLGYSVALAKTPVRSTERFLYHKTTRREVYQRALAEAAGAQDALLFNERGEVTESTIANLVYELDGVRYTPPVDCGLLPGTQRAWLLAQGQVRERALRLEELPRCMRLWLVNSVRGIWPVTLVNNGD